MSKYIPAYKLIAEIESRMEDCKLPDGTFPTTTNIVRYEELSCLRNSVTSLLQEQPKPTCKTCVLYENNCPFIRGKLIPYPNRVCKDYIHSVMKEQEQPEADLEKEIDAVWNPRFNLGWDEKSLLSINRSAFETIARHFWNKGYNARKEK